jgi:hypothetical protein
MDAHANSKRPTTPVKSARTNSAALPGVPESMEVVDAYAEWLISQRGTVDPTLDLEF